MRKRTPKKEGWYRRNWKAVLTAWGIFLTLIAAMGTVLWFVVFRLGNGPGVSHPHIHVPTSLQVVEPSSDYPLSTCVVSGKPLRPIPDRVAVVFEGTQVQFCCETCIPRFEKDPGEYLALIRAATK